VLERELFEKADLPLIFIHELFHFVWVHLGNTKRNAYAALLAEELGKRARGELGESSTVRKQAAPETRDYACESFCDTAAWFFSNGPKSDVANLAARWREKRKAWFETNLSRPLKC